MKRRSCVEQIHEVVADVVLLPSNLGHDLFVLEDDELPGDRRGEAKRRADQYASRKVKEGGRVQDSNSLVGLASVKSSQRSQGLFVSSLLSEPSRREREEEHSLRKKPREE